jgi:probable F420-dependent oxidoreductase
MPWSHPSARLRELVAGIRAIWQSWEDGTPLRFEGDFYTHTRMIPAFDPGPNAFGRPRILTAGVGPRMTAVAGEVADGFLVHPVNSRRSLLELTLPAIARGARRAGRAAGEVEVVCVTTVVTGRDEAQLSAAARRSGRSWRSTAPRPPTGRCSSSTGTARCSPSSSASPVRTGGPRWRDSSTTS